MQFYGFYTYVVGCVNGDARLVGANSSSQGRVEVCYSGMYHSVCDDFWDALNAQVVCLQLGFNNDSSPGKDDINLRFNMC